VVYDMRNRNIQERELAEVGEGGEHRSEGLCAFRSQVVGPGKDA
jgi:hypothetical protein